MPGWRGRLAVVARERAVAGTGSDGNAKIRLWTECKTALACQVSHPGMKQVQRITKTSGYVS